VTLYWEAEGVTLYHGDCLEVLPTLEAGSVDAVVTDLPHGVTQNPWDSVLPLPFLFHQFRRVSKDNAAIVLSSSHQLFSLELIDVWREGYRYDLVWEKDRPSGFLNASRMPLRSHEYVLVFYDSLPTYNPQFFEGEPLHGLGTKYLDKEQQNNNYGDVDLNAPIRDRRKGSTKKYPRSVLRFARPHPSIHPTQKPVGLMEWLIRTYTNRDDLVKDSAMGSGTTGVACVKTGRRFIGIEIDEGYCAIARQRIEEAMLQPRMI